MDTLVPWHENWRDYTFREIVAIKKAKCLHCPYAGHMSTTVDNLYGIYCDYLSRTGEAREVRPEICTHYLDTEIIDKRPAFCYGTILEEDE